MKIFDKAEWHIDAGENKDIVIEKFKLVYEFLNSEDLLSDDGKELLEIGIDSSVSLNEDMLTKGGFEFLSEFYDEVINFSPECIIEELKKRFIN